MNTFSLEEKCVLIFGGQGGIGSAVANMCMGRGAKVCLADIKEHNSVDGAHHTKCDVADQNDVRKCFEWCVSTAGPPDVIINCASVRGETEWQRLYDVNIRGAHIVMEESMNTMSTSKGGKGGVVLSLTSTAGLTCIGAMGVTPAFSASQHALVALTRCFGRQNVLEKSGVRVLAVAVVLVDTDFVANGFKEWTKDEHALQQLQQHAADTEYLKPSEVALRVINALNARTGSVWLVKAKQLQPFNVPDYTLPKTMGYRN